MVLIYLLNQFIHPHFGIFLTNSRLVKEHYSASKSFAICFNKLVVYTPSEYKDLLCFKPNLSKHISTKSSKKAKSYSVDWRNKGVINNIKYQGDCSSDWDFSAVQAIESANTISLKIKKNQPFITK